MENINSESSLEDRRKKLEESLKENKLEIKNLFSQMGVFKKVIENLDLDLEFLGNFSKYSGLEKKYYNMTMNMNFEKNFESMMKINKILDVS